MASGIKLTDYPPHVIQLMLSAQLDSDLKDYYKLMATLQVMSKDSGKANDLVSKYMSVSIPEMEGAKKAQEAAKKLEFDNLDKWHLVIDNNTLPGAYFQKKKSWIMKQKIEQEILKRGQKK